MELDQVAVTELQVGYLTTLLIISLISTISADEDFLQIPSVISSMHTYFGLHCTVLRTKQTQLILNFLQRVMHEKVGHLRVQSMLGFVFCCVLMINLHLRICKHRKTLSSAKGTFCLFAEQYNLDAMKGPEALHMS